jgi:hypothetical protein
MTKERIEKAVEIINYAITNQVSVKEASVKCGMSDTYVKNTKAVVFDKYENGTLDDELFNLFNDTYSQYTNVTGFITQAPKVVGIEEPDKPKDLPVVNGEREKFEQKDDNNAEYTWVGGSNYGDDHIRTLPQLLAASETDLDVWKVARHIINKWDVTMKVRENDELVPKTIQNWQVKAFLERDIQTVREKAIGEIFQEMVENYEAPVFDFTPKPKLNTDIEDKNLLEISIFDLHIGKLAWGGETFENYDVKIARKRFLESIEKLVLRASGFNFERILFPVGNDFFNSDTMENTTTKGTPQDEDLRWQKTFTVGVRLLVDAINMLRKTGVPVDVLVIPGNHDFERSYYMGSYLEAWFKNDVAVNINNHASPRKYYRYGNTLLGLTHGGEEKEASLPLLMATDIESKPMWSSTKFHEWHLGHIHRKRTVKYEINKSRPLNEDLGVTVRYLSSLTGTEEWHHKKGFVGSTKAADGFVWNHEFGLVAHLNTNLIID